MSSQVYAEWKHCSDVWRISDIFNFRLWAVNLLSAWWYTRHWLITLTVWWNSGGRTLVPALTSSWVNCWFIYSERSVSNLWWFLWGPVTTAECLKSLSIRDATCIIHYDFPASPKVFGQRLFCMADNFRNLSKQVQWAWLVLTPFCRRSVISKRNDRFSNTLGLAVEDVSLLCPGSSAGPGWCLPCSCAVCSIHLWEEHQSQCGTPALPGADLCPASPTVALLCPECPCCPWRAEDGPSSLQLPEDLWSLQVFYEHV